MGNASELQYNWLHTFQKGGSGIFALTAEQCLENYLQNNLKELYVWQGTTTLSCNYMWWITWCWLNGDGVPPGLALTEEDLQIDSVSLVHRNLQLNAKNLIKYFRGIWRENHRYSNWFTHTDQKSKDYGNIAQTFRPGIIPIHKSMVSVIIVVAVCSWNCYARCSRRYCEEILKFGVLIRGHVTQIGNEVN